MRFSTLVRYGLPLGVLALGCSRTELPRESPSEAHPAATDDPATLTVDALPDGPRRALLVAAQGHPIASITRRQARNKVTYETTTMIGTTPFFIKVDEDGKVIERRPLAPTPPPRRTAAHGGNR